MTSSELKRRIAAMEKIAPGGSFVFEAPVAPHEVSGDHVERQMHGDESGGAEVHSEAFDDGCGDLYDFARVGYLAFDSQGVISDINLTASEMLGVKRALLLGVPFEAYVAPEDRVLFREHLCRFSTPEQSVTTELHLIRKGASALPVVMQSVLVFDSKNKGFQRRTTITDITERKRVEMALRDNEARLQAILDAVPMAIISVDEAGTIESANPAAGSMFGYAVAELIGQNINILIATPEGETGGSELRDDAAKIPALCNAGRGRRRDGSIIPLDISVSEVRLVGRRVFAVFLRDITERKLAEEALRLRGRQQQAIAELSQQALTGGGLDRLLEAAVSLVPRMLAVEYSRVLEIQPDGKSLLLRAGVGWHDGLVGKATVLMGFLSHSGYTLLSGAPVIVPDMRTEVRFHSSTMLRDHGVVSGVSVIIHARGKPYGVLGAHTTRRRAFTNDDVHFLQSIANVLAAAIERQDLEKEVLDIGDAEQRRIGQDLHDDVCQQLAGVEFLVQALAGELEGTPSAGQVVKIGEYIRKATRHARMLARGLSLVEVEPRGLMVALQELAAHAEELFRIECQYHCESPVLVPDHASAVHLFRIAQEALTNAVRHGHAERVIIALTRDANRAQLTITDDGKGFSTPAGKSGGMGLRTMRYRAEMIGATFLIGPAEGCGTVVTCSFSAAT
jgi:PAS domain S-box-containing protein